MPCYSDYSEPSYEERRAKEELNLVTRLLCSTLRNLRKTDHGAYELLMQDDELRQWWIKHQKFDRKRRQIEISQAEAEVERAGVQADEANRRLRSAIRKLGKLNQ